MSNFMLNFNNQSQGYIESVPQLAGKLWGEAMFYMPDATPFGLVQASRCFLQPSLTLTLTLNLTLTDPSQQVLFVGFALQPCRP